MIGKVLQNNNFKETTRYVLDKEEARLLGGTVMGYKTETISREFLMSRDLNPEIKRPVYHLIDSYSYEDAATKDLTDEFQRDRAIEHFAGLVVSVREPELLRQDDKNEYKQKVNDFIETELYEYQWFCAAHEDTKHRHTHFVASRINLVDGRCIPTWQDKERSHRICREIEQEYGLQHLQSYYEIERRSPTRGQLEKWEKTGIAPVMVVMQDAIDQEVTPGRSLDQVTTALQQQHGIEAKVGLYNGTDGIVFEGTDSKGETVRMSGSQLGRGYTYGAIERRLELEHEQAQSRRSPQPSHEPDVVSAPLQSSTSAPTTPTIPSGNSEATNFDPHAAARSMLQYFRQRLKAQKRSTITTPDGYCATINNSHSITITCKSPNGTEEIIAQDQKTPQGWKVTITQVTPEEWQQFDRYQHQHEAKKQTKQSRQLQQSEQEL